MSKQEGLCNIPALSENSLRKLSEGEGTPRCFILEFMSATFLSVWFLSLKETNWETKKMFLLQNLFSFLRKSKFRILDIQISCVIKRPTIKKKHILLNNLGIKQSLLMKVAQFIS